MSEHRACPPAAAAAALLCSCARFLFGRKKIETAASQACQMPTSGWSNVHYPRCHFARDVSVNRSKCPLRRVSGRPAQPRSCPGAVDGRSATSLSLKAKQPGHVSGPRQRTIRSTAIAAAAAKAAETMGRRRGERPFRASSLVTRQQCKRAIADVSQDP